MTKYARMLRSETGVQVSDTTDAEQSYWSW